MEEKRSQCLGRGTLLSFVIIQYIDPSLQQFSERSYMLYTTLFHYGCYSFPCQSGLFSFFPTSFCFAGSTVLQCFLLSSEAVASSRPRSLDKLFPSLLFTTSFHPQACFCAFRQLLYQCLQYTTQHYYYYLGLYLLCDMSFTMGEKQAKEDSGSSLEAEDVQQQMGELLSLFPPASPSKHTKRGMKYNGYCQRRERRIPPPFPAKRENNRSARARGGGAKTEAQTAIGDAVNRCRDNGKRREWRKCAQMAGATVGEFFNLIL